MTDKKKASAVEGLFTWQSEKPQLIGGRCKSCGTYFFPKFYVVHSPECLEAQIEEVLLSTKGKLESYTIMNYPSPPPFVNSKPFVPYAVGMVSLPEGISVLGMLTGCPVEKLETEMDVELVIDVLCQDDQGNDELTWKWQVIS